MRTEPNRDFKSSSWPKIVLKKWLNIKGQANEFHCDSCTNQGSTTARRKSCSDKDARPGYRMSGDTAGRWLVESSENVKPPQFRSDLSSVLPLPEPAENLRVFVGTWNVGGRAPHGGLKLTDWLMSTKAPADIYVLGFQEIVPLNAGNVLGLEDRGPARKWLSLIRRALNPADSTPIQKSGVVHPVSSQSPRVSFSDLLSMVDAGDEGESPEFFQPLQVDGDSGGYRLVANKQMVGIFLCVWVRAGLMGRVRSIKVSCVGRGILGYMGNKGSISISMTLEQTTFCFVCTHLTSGERDGDELRRNSDVTEILKRTKFPQSHITLMPSMFSPDTILQHNKIIWLGDLNYRLTTSCKDIDELLQKSNWDALLDKDQLRVEQRAGHVFEGWEEGEICFPPTYKYIADSDRYAVVPAKPREKRRTPAWCDRILWRGKGMKQLWYKRGESRFSDHRPVNSLFSVKLDGNMTENMGFHNLL